MSLLVLVGTLCVGHPELPVPNVVCGCKCGENKQVRYCECGRYLVW
jgi:hypothetical protein